MSHRAQRWLFWIFIAVVAFQIYFVREMLAGVILIGVVFAGLAIPVVSAIVLEAAWRWLKTTTAAAWQGVRSAAVARLHLAK